MYDQRIMPIYMLAKYKGVSEFIVMNAYCSSPELKIKTCFGTVDEWNYAMKVAKQSEKFVLDMTTLMTLLFLDKDLWTGIPCELVISEGTYHRLKNIEATRENYTYEGAFLYCTDGQLSFTAKDLQQNIVEQKRVNKFIEQVDRHCKIESGINLAVINADKRNKMIDAIGQANAETIALAAREDAVLWTDDLAIACIASTEFGCKRIWSQVVVNLLDEPMISELNLALYRYGYTFTRIGLKELIFALEKSKWQVNKSPLKELMSIFSDSSINPESITSLFSIFIKYVWQNSMEFTAQQITIVALNELSKRQLGVFIIKNLHINRLFGLDCINANKVRNIINLWLRIS
jgi:hypothetical protein